MLCRGRERGEREGNDSETTVAGGTKESGRKKSETRDKGNKELAVWFVAGRVRDDMARSHVLERRELLCLVWYHKLDVSVPVRLHNATLVL